jgi:hypothetical protein
MEGQVELPLARAPAKPPVADEVIRSQKTFSAAVALAANVSGLDDKEVYMPLDIDASHWTKIRKGDAHFPVDKLNDFCDLVGNEIPLIWWANSRGKGLHMLETESERQLKAERLANEELAKENKLLRALVQGKAA